MTGVPHGAFERLRAEAPVHWHDEPDGPGFWAVTRYDDVVLVNRDNELFSSARGRRCSWSRTRSRSSSSG